MNKEYYGTFYTCLNGLIGGDCTILSASTTGINASLTNAEAVCTGWRRWRKEVFMAGEIASFTFKRPVY